MQFREIARATVRIEVTVTIGDKKLVFEGMQPTLDLSMNSRKFGGQLKYDFWSERRVRRIETRAFNNGHERIEAFMPVPNCIEFVQDQHRALEDLFGPSDKKSNAGPREVPEFLHDLL